MIYFGVIYLVSTLYLILFVSEFKQMRLKSKKEQAVVVADKLSIVTTYKFIWSIIKIPSMKYLIFILLTFRVSVSNMRQSAHEKVISIWPKLADRVLGQVR